MGDYGWAPQRDSNGDSLSGAQLFLGTITNEKEPVILSLQPTGNIANTSFCLRGLLIFVEAAFMGKCKGMGLFVLRLFLIGN